MVRKSTHSFEAILKKYLKKINPAKVLEWGPGYSTELILSVCSNSVQIFTIEHDKGWFDVATKRLGGHKNVNLMRKHTNRHSKYAYTAYKFSPYDFIFIDGRRRVETCFVAMDVISSDGVIVLHDSSRPIYRRPISRYIDAIEERDNTLVFRPK